MEAGPLSGLTQHAASSKAKSLSTSTIRVGPQAACPMGSARSIEAGVSLDRVPRCSTVVSARGKREKYLDALGSQNAQTMASRQWRPTHAEAFGTKDVRCITN